MRPNGEPKTEFTFHYSAMGAGKTLEIMVNEYRMRNAGYNTAIAKPGVDKKAGEEIMTRFGQTTRPVDIVLSPKDGAFSAIRNYLSEHPAKGAWIVYIDEAQFFNSRSSY